MSAYELLKDVELSEDAIKCLYIAGRETQALEVANETIERYKEFGEHDLKYNNILCMMGDIKSDPSFYEKAWKSSNERCARAMRSLAKSYFYD